MGKKRYIITLEVITDKELDGSENLYDILDECIDYSWYIDSVEEVNK